MYLRIGIGKFRVEFGKRPEQSQETSLSSGDEKFLGKLGIHVYHSGDCDRLKDEQARCNCPAGPIMVPSGSDESNVDEAEAPSA